MDLKKYFRRIREIEAEIPEQDTFVTSLETPDGGKPGLITEVPRYTAAKMIAEGKAVLTSEADRESFRNRQKGAREAVTKAESSKRLQVAVISESERIYGRK